MNADPTKTWEAKVYPHPRQLVSCKVSPCGTFAVAGDFDGQLQRWNLTNDQRIPIDGHRTWVQALAFRQDRLFSADYSGQVRCWNIAEEQPTARWTNETAHEGVIRAAVVSPDGRQLATAGNDRVIRLWDVDTGRLVRELKGHVAWIFTLAFHPRNGHLASGDLHGHIKDWDLATGREVREFDASSLWATPESSMSLTGVGGVRSLAFNADGSMLACGGIAEINSATFAAGKPAGLVFDWSRGQLKHALRFKEPYEGFVQTLLFHPEGFWVGAGGGVGGQLWFWRPDEAEPFHTVKQLRHLREVDMHPDGMRLVGATFEAKGSGGNGRRAAAMGDYTDNVGTVRIFNMSQRPPMTPVRPTPPRR